MVGGEETATAQQMSIINVRYTLETTTGYRVLLNHEPILEHSQSTVEFTSPVLKDGRMHTLEFMGEISVKSLVLDGIDTEYFVHHGFTSNGGRGNADSRFVKYYFETPIWSWYLDWKQHDSSKYRLLSKDHSGFLPL